MRIKDLAWRILKKKREEPKNLEEYTKKEYKKKFGVDLDLDNPTTFYEKLNYIKIHYDNPLMQDYVDKVEVKQILDDAGYESNHAKTLAVFDNIKQLKEYIKTNVISTFVVKLNNTSGDVYFYDAGKWRDKHGKSISKSWVFTNIKIGLKTNYYYYFFEKQYKHISPKVLCEEYIPSKDNKGLDEYKFFCNYGKIKMINVVYGRQSDKKIIENFTDENLNPLGVYQTLKLIDQQSLVSPKCMDGMKEFATKMSKPFPILRVDLMTDGEKFYLCEFTFFDCGGNNIFNPPEGNKKIGDLFDISDITKKLSN